MLGRPHQVRGPVVHGDHRGGSRARVPHGQRRRARRASACPPPASTPAGTSGPTGPGGRRPISVGRRPTFYGADGALLVEAYLLEFDGDLYGEEAKVSFVAHLRDERAFDSVDALIDQMGRDVASARQTPGAPAWPEGRLGHRTDGRPKAALSRRGVPEQLGPQLPLEDLAGRVAGEWFGPEPEPAGHVERRQPLGHEPGQLVGAHVLSRDGAPRRPRPPRPSTGWGTPMTAQSATAGCS